MNDGLFVQSLIYFLIGMAILVGIFFLLRSLMLWYWRIGDIIKNQQEQIRLLGRQNTLLEKLVQPQVKQTAVVQESKK